jgi:MinD-like ATPase involved in chromosome partitioning or flagellar assembly
MTAPGMIITFYSYAGGVGRTMTVANAALILAGSGYRVLAIDWDLESPGLHRYFRPFLPEAVSERSLGLIDVLSDPGRLKDPRWIRDCSVPVRSSISRGSIALIPAGRQDQDYPGRVDRLIGLDLLKVLGGESGIADLRDMLTASFDYVLIDGPTGIGKSVDICNARIPDALVALFTLNHKNIAGTAVEAMKALDQNDKLKVFPVPTRVEYGEADKLAAARRHARELFASFMTPTASGPDLQQDSYWYDVEIPYISYYAFEEIPPALRDEPGSSRGLTASHERLLSLITGRSMSVEPLEGEARREIVKAFGFERADRESAIGPKSRLTGPAAIATRSSLRSRWLIGSALVIAACLAALSARMMSQPRDPKRDTYAQVDAMIEQLDNIERRSAESGIDLPKEWLTSANISLRRLREALRKPPPEPRAPDNGR